MQIKNILQEKIIEQIDLSQRIENKELQELIDRIMMKEARSYFLTIEEKKWMKKELFAALRGLDVLQELLEDETITEIMVNGPDNIFVERGGRIGRMEKKFSSVEKLEDVIQQIVAGVNRRINQSSPIADARIMDGSRVNAVLWPVALEGPVLTIRKFTREPLTMEYMVESGTLTEETAEFLRRAVEGRKNIFISGGTGSGKTTFLNALSDFIPRDERVITIEDSAELQIRQVPNLVRLESRNANEEGEKEITIRDLIRTSLRMRPDRIIIGEVRDGACLDLLQAMNTGHNGSLSTGHGNSPKDMLSRLETMVLMGANLPLTAIRRQIASAIDLMVHVARFRDGRRRVVAIMQIAGYDRREDEIRLEPVFEYSQEEDLLKWVRDKT